MLGGGGHLRTEGQGQRQSDLVSRLSRTLKQRTNTSLYVKFKTEDWDLQWAVRGRELHSGLRCRVTLGQKSLCPSRRWAHCPSLPVVSDLGVP